MRREKGTLTRHWAAVAVLLAATALSGCRAADEAAGPQPGSEPAVGPADTASPGTTTGHPLADTSWRLIEFQSMDDAIGVVRPDDPPLYTMRLNADGTVMMRLDCNRANGTWTAVPGADPSSGSFTFGPLAATGAPCPPPAMDERIAADAEYVRSYLVRDGRLYLSLMADGGIYAWEPDAGGTEGRGSGTDVPFATIPDPAIEGAVLGAYPDYSGDFPAGYVYSRLDLDDDGRDEVFVYLLGPFFCGTGGCNLLLLTPTSEGYAVVNDFPISRTPVIVSPEKAAGWRELFRPESGGGAAPSHVRHVFDGTAYVERERLPGETAPTGIRVLSGDFTFADGIPLKPRR